MKNARASSSNNYARVHVRTRARFLGVKRCKNHKKAAERIDDANYVRVFFLGYEKQKDARHLKLASIGRVSACKAGTDTPSSGQSTKLSEKKEYAACPHSHLISIGDHLRAVLCPPDQAKDESSARLPLTPHPRAGGLREAGWCGAERRAGIPPGSASYQERFLET